LLLELEMADLERFFEKNTLGPLGVNNEQFFANFLLIMSLDRVIFVATP
jgi:hypothetical protein